MVSEDRKAGRLSPFRLASRITSTLRASAAQLVKPADQAETSKKWIEKLAISLSRTAAAGREP